MSASCSTGMVDRSTSPDRLMTASSPTTMVLVDRFMRGRIRAHGGSSAMVAAAVDGDVGKKRADQRHVGVRDVADRDGDGVDRDWVATVSGRSVTA